MPPFVFGCCRFQFALPLVAAMLVAGAGRAAPPEPITLKGHDGWVGGVAFSPDGKTIATASADKTVKFWETASGKELATLEAHGDVVTAVTYSKDGTHFATASFDGTAKVWGTATRKPVQTFSSVRGAIHTVAFNPNGRALAAGGIDGTVRVWNVTSGRELSQGEKHQSWVNALTYRPDGKVLASVSSDNEVWFRDPDGTERIIVRPKLGEVRSAAFSPDSKLLATGTRYGVTKVWDEKGDEVAALKGKHTGDVWSVAFSADGKLLAAGDGDWNKPSDIVLWEVPSAKPEGFTKTWKERTRLKHTNEVLSIAWHPKKPVLAAGAWDKTAKVWDLTESKPEKTPPQPLPQEERGKNQGCLSPSPLGGGVGEGSVFVRKADR